MRAVHVATSGRLAFPDVADMDEIRAEEAYQAMGGSASRYATILREYREVCARGNVTRHLPDALLSAALDGFAVKTLRAVARCEQEGKKFTAVPGHERSQLNAQCRRAMRECLAACRYPNAHFDRQVTAFLKGGNTTAAGRVPRFCTAARSCVQGFRNTNWTGVEMRKGYGGTSLLILRFTWAWYRDLYLRGLAVVESHLVLRYLETLSPTLHRVIVVVQEKGTNLFHEEERLIWETGEGTLLLRP
jgi:hypothetical protein